MDTMITNTELVENARKLRGFLRANAEDSALNRRLAMESAAALRAGGFLQVMVPRRCGGSEADFQTFCQICEELARGDSAAGWLTMIAGSSAALMGLLPDKTRSEVYDADPRATVIGQWAPTAKSTPVDGGWKLTGRWPWASGCFEAQWSFVGSPVPDSSGKMVDVRLALVPTSELTIEDTWHVAGMCGTGSNTFVGDDIFVPSHRAMLMSELIAGVTRSDHSDEAIYRAPLITALPLAMCATAVGIAESAFDHTLENLERGKPIVASCYTDARQSPSYQLNLADARGAIDSARLHVMRAASDIDRSVASGVPMSDLERARVRLDEAVAQKRVREAVDLLLNIGGASAFMLSNPVQRIWRDIETCTRHAYINGDIGREIYARALLNLDQVSSSF
ncbi:acyl-CoA dehydrogenase family protein [Phyllobacterium zundukense]|uniref:Oxidoreductase n=1 Tax=Phyllobacterium zundukense TaxID=1867719 RepID=A0A2N9W199_9HYPH|nr:acyl-CoA dehydrogenase family protein [Phyllobacterium zundukense]ATU95383.1 hypothetical protein BLM14_27185 [Phyllobacterium zundukense]PIO45517.1 hypothetical protein B5P45_07165 [Phyllobacterium zundukense]